MSLNQAQGLAINLREGRSFSIQPQNKYALKNRLDFAGAKNDDTINYSGANQQREGHVQRSNKDCHYTNDFTGESRSASRQLQAV